jgi:hypothetical protein
VVGAFITLRFASDAVNCGGCMLVLVFNVYGAYGVVNLCTLALVLRIV